MSTKNTKKEQKERAARLHKQITDIKKGNLPMPKALDNPRDFIAEKMRELTEKEKLDEKDTDESLNEK